MLVGVAIVEIIPTGDDIPSSIGSSAPHEDYCDLRLQLQAPRVGNISSSSLPTSPSSKLASLYFHADYDPVLDRQRFLIDRIVQQSSSSLPSSSFSSSFSSCVVFPPFAQSVSVASHNNNSNLSTRRTTMQSVRKKGGQDDEEEGEGADEEEGEGGHDKVEGNGEKGKREEGKGPLKERMRQKEEEGEEVTHKKDDDTHQKSSLASLPSPSSSQTCQSQFLQYACPSPSTSTLSSSSTSSYSAASSTSTSACSHPSPPSSNVLQQGCDLFQRRTYYPYSSKQEPHDSLLPPERFAPAAPWIDDVQASISSRPCQCDVKNGMNYDFIYGTNFRQNRGCTSSNCVNNNSRDNRWVYTIPLSNDQTPIYLEKPPPHLSHYQHQHGTLSRNTNPTVATSCADQGPHPESHAGSQDVSRLEFDVESPLQSQLGHVHDSRKRPFQTRTSYPFRKLASFHHPQSSLCNVLQSPLPSMALAQASHTYNYSQLSRHVSQPCMSSSISSFATTAASSVSTTRHLDLSVASVDRPLLKETCDDDDDDDGGVDDGDGDGDGENNNNKKNRKDIENVSQPNGADRNIGFDEALPQSFYEAMSLQQRHQ